MKPAETILYGTHEAIRDLTAAGMPEPQAEAVMQGQVRLIEHELASKADITAVRADIAAVQGEVEKQALETSAEVEKLRLVASAEFGLVRAEIEKLPLGIKAHMEAQTSSLIKWMAGTNLAVVGILMAAFKFL